ncbi:hypothetical protein D3C81_1625030 [compost metagenome]
MLFTFGLMGYRKFLIAPLFCSRNKSNGLNSPQRKNTRNIQAVRVQDIDIKILNLDSNILEPIDPAQRNCDFDRNEMR